MSQTAIKIENIGKLYRLGEIGTGTISHDLNRWWAKVRGKEDPFAKIGNVNDRTVKGDNEYVWALKDISFDVNQGEVLGIIGRNGAGKSTLLKILSKVTTASTGKIKVRGRIASLLEVGTGFHPELTGRENIFLNGAILGMTKAEIRSKFDEIVDFAGVERYIDTPVKRYSSGMYVRLAFAVAAFLEPEILIVDEVLAVGDVEFQKKCLGRMQDVSQKDGRTVLFVSHNLGSIQALCHRCVLLRNGRLAENGTTTEVLKKYLENSALKNEVVFEENSPLRKMKIYQDVDVIRIEADYSHSEGLDIPHLGFIIYNSTGNPVFGSNPNIHNLSPNSTSKYTDGRINIVIKEPKLLDDVYNVSVWFGDSKENFVEYLNCLSFEVNGMTANKQLPVSIIGNVVPEVQWTY